MYFFSLWAVMDYEVVWEDLFGKSNANFELEMQYRYHYMLHTHSQFKCAFGFIKMFEKSFLIPLFQPYLPNESYL